MSSNRKTATLKIKTYNDIDRRISAVEAKKRNKVDQAMRNQWKKNRSAVELLAARDQALQLVRDLDRMQSGAEFGGITGNEPHYWIEATQSVMSLFAHFVKNTFNRSNKEPG